MNKVQVGNAPSPNIKAVKSKIGSLDNATYKPGGGKVKIENRKLEFGNVTPKIAAKNEAYTPSGGVKKVTELFYKTEFYKCSKEQKLTNGFCFPDCVHEIRMECKIEDWIAAEHCVQTRWR